MSLTTTSAPLRFHPLQPATKAAQDAMLAFMGVYDSRLAEDRAHLTELTRKCDELKAQDPGALLNQAEELERWAAKADANAQDFPVAAVQYRESAARFREEASALRSKSDEIVAPLAKAA